jgi:hypothetical protein
MVVADALPFGPFGTQAHHRNIQPRQHLIGGQPVQSLEARPGGRLQQGGIFLLTATRAGFHMHQRRCN